MGKDVTGPGAERDDATVQRVIHRKDAWLPVDDERDPAEVALLEELETFGLGQFREQRHRRFRHYWNQPRAAPWTGRANPDGTCRAAATSPACQPGARPPG